MDRLTYEELEKLLNEASSEVKVGGFYRHYKDPVSRYEVKGLAVLEASDDIAVRYSSPEHSGVEFIRPLTSWLGTIDGKARFEPIDG